MALIDVVREKMKNSLNEDYLEETSDKYYRYYVRIKSNRIRDATQILVNDLDGRLVALSADDVGVLGFDIIYHFDFTHLEKHFYLSVKARVPRENPVIDSVANIAWSVNWAERELMDLMGIKFDGHPDPRKLFLPYEWPSEEVA
ncbi:MAG: NADH-quinone oxidoreductase subunit C [Candidatus Heimdallarchaeota archaeon]